MLAVHYQENSPATVSRAKHDQFLIQNAREFAGSDLFCPDRFYQEEENPARAHIDTTGGD